MPRISQTTEFMTLVTVAAGASGRTTETWARIELAAADDEATAEAGIETTIELTAETIGARLAGTDATLEATIGADKVLEERTGVAALDELE
ncbi:hypothetical protein LTS18_012544, partial [Coniosporium uncinatum]